MRKFLLILLVTAVLFSGCQKDTTTLVTLSATDLGTINSQLKGTWLFPFETVTVVDDAGKTLVPAENEAAPAFQFDGTSKVTILTNLETQAIGTYTLTSTNGVVFLNIAYPGGTTVNYQVTLLNDNTLKLQSTQTTTYQSAPAKEVINTSLQKQTAVDISGNLVRVTVLSDSTFNATVYVSYSNPGSPRATPPKVLDNVSNVSKTYNFAFAADHGDYILIDVVGSPPSTQLYAYFNGVPVSGETVKTATEVRTGTGWYLK